MARTLAERIASVQAAIEAIESGAQSIGNDGETTQRPDLATLYKQEARLLALQTREDRGGVVRVAET
jgi:hypothetical protein